MLITSCALLNAHHPATPFPHPPPFLQPSVSQSRVSYGFTHTWNIRNSTEDHRGREGKLNGKKSERETNHKRLLIIRNKLRVAGEEWLGWGNWVMGIKEGVWCYEHWVLYATDELLNSTSETNDVLYVG